MRLAFKADGFEMWMRYSSSPRIHSSKYNQFGYAFGHADQIRIRHPAQHTPASSNHGELMRISPNPRSHRWLCAFVMPLCTGIAAAQSPQYDVATIRASKSADSVNSMHTRDLSFDAENIDLPQLIQFAYGVRRNVIFGLPSWTDGARFDINAKVLETYPSLGKGLTREQFQSMLQKLLADRFGLKTHIETKVLPVYNLEIAKSGIKFKEYILPASGEDKSGNVSQHGTSMTATGIQMRELVKTLTDELQRTVIDKTGLVGKYDMNIVWTRDDAPVAGAEKRDDAPSLFTAVEEQLGLKLIPSKGPVDTLVIDNVAQPTEN